MKPLSLAEVIELFAKVDPFAEVHITETGEEREYYVVYTSLPHYTDDELAEWVEEA